MENIKITLAKPITSLGTTLTEISTSEDKFNVELLTVMTKKVLCRNEITGAMTWEEPSEMEQMCSAISFAFNLDQTAVKQISAKDYIKIVKAISPFLADSPE